MMKLFHSLFVYQTLRNVFINLFAALGNSFVQFFCVLFIFIQVILQIIHILQNTSICYLVNSGRKEMLGMAD